MATIALPEGATKALSTSKGKAYAAGGAVALVLAAYLLLSRGGTETARTTPSKAGTPATTVAVTTPAPPAVTTPFAPSARNPFTKGDGTQPATS